MWLCAYLLSSVVLQVITSGFVAPESVAQDKKSIEELLQEVAYSEKPDEAPALAELSRRADAREGVLEALRKTDKTEVMGAAVLVLGRIGKRARNELKEILEPKEYHAAQGNVLAGLGVVGAEGAWLAPQVLELVEFGLEGLEKRQERGGVNALSDVRTSQALMVLAKIGADRKASLALIERFVALDFGARDEFPQICRMAATCALWSFTGAEERALELFDRGLELGTEGAAVERAVYGLGEMGEHAAPLRSKLAQRLPAASPQMKVLLSEALDKIDGKKPVRGPTPPVK